MKAQAVPSERWRKMSLCPALPQTVPTGPGGLALAPSPPPAFSTSRHTRPGPARPPARADAARGPPVLIVQLRCAPEQCVRPVRPASALARAARLTESLVVLPPGANTLIGLNGPAQAQAFLLHFPHSGRGPRRHGGAQAVPRPDGRRLAGRAPCLPAGRALRHSASCLPALPALGRPRPSAPPRMHQLASAGLTG